jgi:hypothetical protein
MQNLTRLSLRNNPSLKNLPPSLGKVQSLDSIEADQGLNTQVNEILKATRALRNSHVTSN